jgi:hypothetical protein
MADRVAAHVTTCRHSIVELCDIVAVFRWPITCTELMLPMEGLAMFNAPTTLSSRATRDLTRASLFYVASYLVSSGLAMTLSPQLALDMLGSNGHYETTFVQMCGLFVIGLAALVIQTIRHRLVVLYPTIIGVRVAFCCGYVVLYERTRDPFFLAVLAIVGLGLLLSSVCFVIDRRRA